MALQRTLRQWRATPHADRMLFLRACVELLWIHSTLMLRRSYPEITDTDEHVATAQCPVGHEDVNRARRYARWLDLVSRRGFIRASCLDRSLALHWWLRRGGSPSHLRIGVLKDGNALKAHAWVELGGVIVNDRLPDIERFRRLTRGGIASDTTSNHVDVVDTLKPTFPPSD